MTGVKIYLQRQIRGSREWLGGAVRAEGDPLDLTPRRNHFITKENGRRVATPLLMALILVEVTDVVFAVDSIPAIFAVTLDSLIVFTSNIFAILGLRSLFFLLAGLVDRFRYLKVGLAAVLVFVGIKMTLVELYKIPPLVSLGVILGISGISVFGSLLVKPSLPRPVKLESLPGTASSG